MYSVALSVQIYLQTNRVDLALKEVAAAKRWAQDSLLVNVAESWVGLRVVYLHDSPVLLNTHSPHVKQGGEKYQSAFYVYEELASNPNSTAPLSIVGQAIAEIHLGRFPEAEAALTAALEKYPDDVELIANTIVLNVLTGKDATELTSYVQPFNCS